MDQPAAETGQPISAQAFDRLLAELRPRLHRYCARMVGSVIDAEDVVQEALVKAIEAFRDRPAIVSAQAWLFRIAHNTALDFLRRRARLERLSGDEDPSMVAGSTDELHQRQAAAAGLHAFMRLPVAQRSSVILMDVLGYSLAEIGAITASSIPAVKAALHRGRERLRTALEQGDDRPLPALSATERARLAAYVDRFNARDFDAVRDMLADDVRLEVVNRSRLRGRTQVEQYFGNYARLHDWQLRPGWVEGRAAVIACDASGQAMYFILLDWNGARVEAIRDFRHARYAVEGANIVVAG